MKTLAYTGDCLTYDTLRAYHNGDHTEKSGINLHYNPMIKDDLKNIYEVSVDVLKNLDLKQSSLGKYLGWYRKWQIKRLIKSVSIKGTSKTKDYIGSKAQIKLATKVQNLVHKYMNDDKKYEFKRTKFNIGHIEDGEQRAPIEIPQTTEQDETDYSSSPSSSIEEGTPFGSIDDNLDESKSPMQRKGISKKDGDLGRIPMPWKNPEPKELRTNYSEFKGIIDSKPSPRAPSKKDQFLSVSDQKRSCISEESKWPKLKPQPEKPAFEESISFQDHLLRQKETLKYLNHKDFLA